VATRSKSGVPRRGNCADHNARSEYMAQSRIIREYSTDDYAVAWTCIAKAMMTTTTTIMTIKVKKVKSGTCYSAAYT